jgi:hypothetical protein
MRVPGNASATAPALGEQGQAHIRGVSDPNAQFTLMERPSPAARQASSQNAGQDRDSTALCDPSSLEVYEAAAAMNGDERSLRLAIKNNGKAACHLAGSPSISLEDAIGSPVASLTIRQTGASSLAGAIAPPMRDVASISASPAQSVDVVLPPSGEASFEIRWSSGDDCQSVASIGIALDTGVAGAANADAAPKPMFAIHHSLKVCNGEVRVTSLLAGSSV